MTLEDTEKLSKHGLNVILAIDLLGNVHLSFLGFADSLNFDMASKKV